MDPTPPNPFATPETGELLAPAAPVLSGVKSPLPPLTPARLAIAFALITVAWLMVWAQFAEKVRFGYMIPGLIFPLYARVTNPHSQRRDENIKWYHSVLMIGGFVTFMVVMIWDFEKKLPPPFKAVLMHPMTFVLGWLINCRILLADWRKRRNNPPYQPKPHAELPASSPWKPLPRPERQG